MVGSNLPALCRQNVIAPDVKLARRKVNIVIDCVIDQKFLAHDVVRVGLVLVGILGSNLSNPVLV